MTLRSAYCPECGQKIKQEGMLRQTWGDEQ